MVAGGTSAPRQLTVSALPHADSAGSVFSSSSSRSARSAPFVHPRRTRQSVALAVRSVAPVHAGVPVLHPRHEVGFGDRPGRRVDEGSLPASRASYSDALLPLTSPISGSRGRRGCPRCGRLVRAHLVQLAFARRQDPLAVSTAQTASMRFGSTSPPRDRRCGFRITFARFTMRVTLDPSERAPRLVGKGVVLLEQVPSPLASRSRSVGVPLWSLRRTRTASVVFLSLFPPAR